MTSTPGNPRIILDTDIDTDCDDAGALAVLHAMAAGDECELLGVICSIPLPGCARAVQAINAAYGRTDLPVGLIDLPDFATNARWQSYRQHRTRLGSMEPSPLYHDRLATALPCGLPAPLEAVSLYRQLLASAPDQSVTICAVGTLSALERLLASPADRHSALTGADLVRRKVRELVSMAGVDFPVGRDPFNWRMDLPAAAAIVRDWPTPLTTSAAGGTIRTGARFMAAAPPGHPVREAYRTFLGGLDRSRSSWDLVAALYAVRGVAGGFTRSPDLALALDETSGEHAWSDAAADPPRRYITPAIDDAAMAHRLEELMLASLDVPHLPK